MRQQLKYLQAELCARGGISPSEEVKVFALKLLLLEHCVLHLLHEVNLNSLWWCNIDYSSLGKEFLFLRQPMRTFLENFMNIAADVLLWSNLKWMLKYVN